MALAASLAQVREMGTAPALRAWGARELYPGPEVTTAAQLRDYVRRTVISYHHQVGTCKMGVDAKAAMTVTSYEAPPVRKAGAKVASVDELVQKLHNEAKVI